MVNIRLAENVNGNSWRIINVPLLRYSKAIILYIIAHTCTIKWLHQIKWHLKSCLGRNWRKSLVSKKIRWHWRSLFQFIIFNVELLMCFSPRANIKETICSFLICSFLFSWLHSLCPSNPNTFIFVIAPISCKPKQCIWKLHPIAMKLTVLWQLIAAKGHLHSYSTSKTTSLHYSDLAW